MFSNCIMALTGLYSHISSTQLNIFESLVFQAFRYIKYPFSAAIMYTSYKWAINKKYCHIAHVQQNLCDDIINCIFVLLFKNIYIFFSYLSKEFEKYLFYSFLRCYKVLAYTNPILFFTFVSSISSLLSASLDIWKFRNPTQI